MSMTTKKTMAVTAGCWISLAAATKLSCMAARDCITYEQSRCDHSAAEQKRAKWDIVVVDMGVFLTHMVRLHPHMTTPRRHTPPEESFSFMIDLMETMRLIYYDDMR